MFIACLPGIQITSQLRGAEQTTKVITRLQVHLLNSENFGGVLLLNMAFDGAEGSLPDSETTTLIIGFMLSGS